MTRQAATAVLWSSGEMAALGPALEWVARKEVTAFFDRWEKMNMDTPLDVRTSSRAAWPTVVKGALEGRNSHHWGLVVQPEATCCICGYDLRSGGKLLPCGHGGVHDSCSIATEIICAQGCHLCPVPIM
jgi:hypothetical protein